MIIVTKACLSQCRKGFFIKTKFNKINQRKTKLSKFSRWKAVKKVYGKI